MNFRRKRRRKAPRCVICTPNRLGNSKKRGTQARVEREAAKRGADKAE